MCGSLRFEKMNKVIGELVPILDTSKVLRWVRWQGHHRSEKELPEGAVTVKIPVTEYSEKNVPFQVGEGKAIEALYVKKDTFPGGEAVFIITRPASKEELKKSPAPRHPRIIDQ